MKQDKEKGFWNPRNGVIVPRHIIYGYGLLEVEEEITHALTPDEYGNYNSSAMQIRAGLTQYGQYHGKRFKTKTIDGVLHIVRLK